MAVMWAVAALPVPRRCGDEPVVLLAHRARFDPFPTGMGMNRQLPDGTHNAKAVPRRCGDEPLPISHIKCALPVPHGRGETSCPWLSAIILGKT